MIRQKDEETGEKPKLVYNYFESLKDMEGLHEEPAKIKDVFFKGTKQEPFSALSKKSIKQEMTKSFAPRRPLTIALRPSCFA